MQARGKIKISKNTYKNLISYIHLVVESSDFDMNLPLKGSKSNILLSRSTATLGQQLCSSGNSRTTTVATTELRWLLTKRLLLTQQPPPRISAAMRITTTARTRNPMTVWKGKWFSVYPSARIKMMELQCPPYRGFQKTLYCCYIAKSYSMESNSMHSAEVNGYLHLHEDACVSSARTVYSYPLSQGLHTSARRSVCKGRGFEP
ncbi:hypothetical protein BDM02DRAFT_829443 [Thelephora ganbajun]|uniref:Uncharacterized protein n=1 Tax=Thelephora ganbajun TaxID=370292 RepID=A0ACB6Z5G1_THEGA|nr:hypothetical protein BDM02DRAFT_829443 [Thelephora ganbajun]